MKNAAVYIRVSTDDQLEYSPESQLQEIMAYANRHDLIVSKEHIYTDAGISGRNARRRPQFNAMVSAAKEKPAPFETILVWKFSRFARNQEESILYKSLLRKECGVDVVSITEETGDSMFGSLIERIIEWMDEFYSIRLSQEVKTKMAMIAKKGIVQFPPPFGYRTDGKHHIVVVPEEAAWVRFIFESYAAGKSMLSIARQLTDAGVKTRHGNDFEARGVQYILCNPFYKGYTRWSEDGQLCTNRLFDSEDMIIAKGDFEPIISEDLFDSLQHRLRNQTSGRHKCEKPVDVKKHWLSGLVKCSSCGASLSYSKNPHDAFQCWKYGKGHCKVSHFIRRENLENAFFSALTSVSITDSFIEQHTAAPEPSLDYAPVIARYERMLARAETAYLEGLNSLEEYRALKSRIEAQLSEVLRQQAESTPERNVPSSEDIRRRFDSVISLLRDDAVDIAAKNEAVRSIVEKCVFCRAENRIDVFFRL